VLAFRFPPLYSIAFSPLLQRFVGFDQLVEVPCVDKGGVLPAGMTS
jgi:hypothetical protein